jgi:hypothetical protein
LIAVLDRTHGRVRVGRHPSWEFIAVHPREIDNPADVCAPQYRHVRGEDGCVRFYWREPAPQAGLRLRSITFSLVLSLARQRKYIQRKGYFFILGAASKLQENRTSGRFQMITDKKLSEVLNWRDKSITIGLPIECNLFVIKPPAGEQGGRDEQRGGAIRGIGIAS